jgi:hypothetical protein
MALRPTPGYPQQQIKVLAKVTVSIPEADLELRLDWGDAVATKAKAAKWLKKLDPKPLPQEITVVVKIEQRSDDSPFVSKAKDTGAHHKEFAIEYGAKFLETYPNWGRGR